MLALTITWMAMKREGDLVKLTIMVNGDPVDALAMIVHRAHAAPLCPLRQTQRLDPTHDHFSKLPFKRPAIGGQIIARETVSALRKDVTAKCYGGDITPKRKLLEKQKEGQKKSTVAQIVKAKSVALLNTPSLLLPQLLTRPAPMQFLAPYAGCAMG